MAMEDYYFTLGLTREAGPSVVKMAYEGRLKELARSQPDPAKRAAEEGRLKKAYRTLSNPATRSQYDRQFAKSRPEWFGRVLIAVGTGLLMLFVAAAFFYTRSV